MRKLSTVQNGGFPNIFYKIFYQKDFHVARQTCWWKRPFLVGCQDKSGPGKIHEVILVIIYPTFPPCYVLWSQELRVPTTSSPYNWTFALFWPFESATFLTLAAYSSYAWKLRHDLTWSSPKRLIHDCHLHLLDSDIAFALSLITFHMLHYRLKPQYAWDQGNFHCNFVEHLYS